MFKISSSFGASYQCFNVYAFLAASHNSIRGFVRPSVGPSVRNATFFDDGKRE